MKIPIINFKYWFNQNQANALIENRFKSMITRISNIYIENNNYKQVYFCDNDKEITRLKDLNYNELENEIIMRIQKINDIDKADENEILDIFDLINIWGGLQGGSNFYNIKNGTSTRIQYKEWLQNYVKLIKKAILKDSSSYSDILDGKIPNLNMSFGSKHISFWSRKNGNEKCLIVIDNKIAGVTGVKKAINADFKDIIQEVHNLEAEIKLEPQMIEKALFSFHSNFFDNETTKFRDKIHSIDYSVALMIKRELGISDEILEKKKRGPKTLHSKKIQIITILKTNTIKSNEGIIYIKSNYIEKEKKLKKYTDKKSSLKYKGEIYLKYSGYRQLLKIQ